MTPAAISIPFFRASPLRGAIRPYNPVGISRLRPVGIALRELGGMVVCFMARMLYPIELGVALCGRYRIGFVLSVDQIPTVYL